MLFPNFCIGNVFQIQDSSRLNQIETDIGRVPTLDVVLSHLALHSGLVYRVVGMAPVHHHLKYENGEPEEVVIGCSIHILETQPHESGRSEVLFADCATEHFVSRRIGCLNRVKVNHEQLSVRPNEHIRVVYVADHITGFVQATKQFAQVPGNSQQFVPAEARSTLAFKNLPRGRDAKGHQLGVLVQWNLRHQVTPHGFLFAIQGI